MNEQRKETLRAALRSNMGESSSPDRKESLRNLIRKEKENKEFKFGRFLAESLAKGAIGLADIPQIIQRQLPGIPIEFDEETGKFNTAPRKEEGPLISEKILENLNLNTQVPTTGFQRSLGHGAEFVGGTLGGAGLGTAAKAAKLAKTAKLLGTPSTIKELAKQSAIAGTAGTIGGGLQETGINPLVSDVAGMLVAPGVMPAGKKAAATVNRGYSNIKDKLTGAAQEVEAAKKIRSIVGEENIPKVLENIQNYEAPLGYQPTTAEIAENIPLAQTQRAREAVVGSGIAERQEAGKNLVRNALLELSEGKPSIGYVQEYLEGTGKLAEESRGRLLKHAEEQYEKNLRGFEPKISSQEAGEIVQKKLSEKTEGLKQARREKTENLYDKLKENLTPVSPSKSFDYIDENMRFADKDTRDLLKRYKHDLEPNISDSAKLKKDINFYDTNVVPLLERAKNNPAAIQKIKEQFPDPSERLKPSAAKLENVRKAINKRLEIIGNNPARTDETRLLRGLMSNISEDLSVVPEAAAARTAYREASLPIHQIEKGPLGNITKKDLYGETFKIRPETIPKKLALGLESSSNAEALLRELPDAETRHLMQGWINNEIFSEIAPGGKVKKSLIEDWKQNNPGAFKLYPTLETKLGNTQNAQKFVTELEIKNNRFIDKYHKDILKGITGLDENQVVTRIMTGAGKGKRAQPIIEILKKDPSGLGIEALQGAVAKHITSKIEGKSDLLHTKMNNYMKENKHILEQIYNPEQMRVLEDVEKIMKGRARAETLGLGKGSQTAPNQMNNMQLAMNVSKGMLRKMLSKATFKASDYFIDWLSDTREGGIQKMIDRALREPEYAKLLLEKPLSNKGSLNSISKDIKDYYKNRTYLLSPLVNSRKEDKDK